MKKISAIGIKEDGMPFKVNNAGQFKAELDSQPKGKYKITVEKYYRKSTPQQFGWLYALIYPLSLIALNDAGYEFTTLDEVDIFWKELYANKPVLNMETGQTVNIPKSKREFVTIDQMAYCDSIRKYCAEYLGVNIPDPTPNWKELQKVQE